MKFPYKILLVLLMPCVCSSASAATAMDAANARASVPEFAYRSDFVDYQSFREEPLMSWDAQEKPVQPAAEAVTPHVHEQHESQGAHDE